MESEQDKKDGDHWIFTVVGVVWLLFVIALVGSEILKEEGLFWKF